MNEVNCEKVLIAKMAEFDGEEAADLIDANRHLEHCQSCRNELTQMRTLDLAFSKVYAREHEVDLWPLVERRIAAEPRESVRLAPFVLLVSALVSLKLFEMLREVDPSFMVKLAPLIVAILLFTIIKENPFRINTGLNIKGE
jgi:hypothetical protein